MGYTEEVKISPVSLSDAAVIAEIYNYYIKNTVITLEETEVSAVEFKRRIAKITKNYPFLVAKSKNGEVLGYAYLNVFNERSAYRITADLSIYVSHEKLCAGIGEKLFSEIEKAAKERGFKNLISIITANNDRSKKFHERNGFVKVGKIDDVAFKFNNLIGIEYYKKSI